MDPQPPRPPGFIFMGPQPPLPAGFMFIGPQSPPPPGHMDPDYLPEDVDNTAKHPPTVNTRAFVHVPGAPARPRMKRYRDIFSRSDMNYLMELHTAKETAEMLGRITHFRLEHIPDDGPEGERKRSIVLTDRDLFQECASAVNGFSRDAEEEFFKQISAWPSYPPIPRNRNWSRIETRNLIEGLMKYGTGKWLNIAAEYLPGFHRSSGDVQHKYETLCRNFQDGYRAGFGLTQHMYQRFEQAKRVLRQPLTEGFNRPLFASNRTIETVVISYLECEPERWARFSAFLRTPEVDGYLIKARTLAALELTREGLSRLRAAGRPDNQLLKEDIEALDNIIQPLQRETSNARLAIENAYAARPYPFVDLAVVNTYVIDGDEEEEDEDEEDMMELE